MTIIAACRYKEEAVMIADSRVTAKFSSANTFQDTLQKILPLGPKIALSFCGDVKATSYIVEQLRKRIKTQNRLKALRKLAAELPRIAKHYYGVYKARTRKTESVSFILGGVTEAGVAEMWFYNSPAFNSEKLSSRPVVLGSGGVVQKSFEEKVKKAESCGSLKDFANYLVTNLDSILAEKAHETAETVGGMFQVILLVHDGIRPFNYGFSNIDPENSPEAKSMRFESGRWIQRDMSKNLEIPLAEPKSCK